MNFLYECILYLGTLFLLPKLLFQLAVKGKYRGSFSQRFGTLLPKIDKTTIWIHAVSLGETKAVSGLAKVIREQQKDAVLIVSSVTETGHAEAKRSMPFADHHVFLPIDFSWNVAKTFAKVKPQLVIVTETDLWYNFLRLAKSHGAHIALVNGKISERSAGRYKWLTAYTKKLFSLVDVFCVQSEEYSQCFASIGVASEKIKITGNLKFDETIAPLDMTQKRDLLQRLGIQPGDQVIVIGSTHNPEERELLLALKPLWNQFPRLRMIVVPRHPERFDEVADTIVRTGLSLQRYSEGASSSAQVVLVDAMGLLRQCYQIADLAIVAGSFTDRVGGHNILEPCHFGVPLLFGPYMHTQPELTRLVIGSKAGLQVNLESVKETCADLISNPAKRQQFGAAGLALISSNRGAIQRTWDPILNRYI